MGTQPGVAAPRRLRAVFDTNVVFSALLYTEGRLAWLRGHWRRRRCEALISRQTAAELIRILAYPKFHLNEQEQLDLLGDYLPFCETVVVTDPCPILCRDPKDQRFLDLAHSGKAQVLVTGDADLLALTGQTAFVIETPAEFQARKSTEK